LAKQIVDDFHTPSISDVTKGVPSSISIGTTTAAEFNRVFRDRQVPEEIPEVRVSRLADRFMTLSQKRGGIVIEQSGPHEISPLGKERWSKVLALLGQVPSVSEAERLIKQNAVEINGQVLADAAARIDFNEKSEFVVRIGKKKFLRIIVE